MTKTIKYNTLTKINLPHQLNPMKILINDDDFVSKIVF